MPSSPEVSAAASATRPAPSPDDEGVLRLNTLAAPEAAQWLAGLADAEAVDLLAKVSSSVSRGVLDHLPPDRRERLVAAAPASLREQWLLNLAHPTGSVGRIMQPPAGVVPVGCTAAEAIALLRELHATQLITYLYAVDAGGRLAGVIVLRDLFLARPDQAVREFMIAPPFYLTPGLPILEAMKVVVSRHYPVYPVCDDTGRLVGLVRGHLLFEKQAYVISAQSGKMVGVRVQERLSTHWLRSLGYRHPWLLFNLLVSMLSAAVVSLYQDAIRQLVILAIFLPVVSAQARNSGAQTMAVTLRGLTTGEWGERTSAARVMLKEGVLGLLNGVAIGLVGGIFIYVQARYQGMSNPETLAGVLIAAMGLGCTVSAVFGVAIPLVLRRLGADPALAAGIIFTTIATVVSQASFLALAVWWAL
jgi:magnesium transporter